VADEEIEALAPDKSMEIDLSRFVDLSEVDPTLFERGYVLAPDRGALKAYRLLARSMEEAPRAGIATFVMRGTEYLVAILAEDGLLRAQTLRFSDELRTPEDVGLPDLDDADATRVKAFACVIDALEAKRLDPELLRDEASRRLRELIASKAEGAGAAARDDAGADADAPDPETVDLMDVLKRSLAHDEDAAPDAAAGDAAAPAEALDGLTRAELYERAQALDVPGRSSMTKAALVAAVRERG
jgi:DNA end-binding protein Ku